MNFLNRAMDKKNMSPTVNVPLIDLFALYKPEAEIDHQIVYDAQYLLKNYCL